MTEGEIKEKLGKLIYEMWTMTRELYEIKKMLCQGVDVAIDNGCEIVFYKDGKEVCRCFIESKDDRRIMPKDVEKALDYFTPENQNILLHEKEKCKAIEDGIKQLGKKIEEIEKDQRLQGDFV